MAFFKFRLPGQTAGDAASNFTNSPAESVEVLRRRARHRLIGATVLVIIGVVGFPLVFDTQPRPVSVDIAVDIPDRIKTKPMVSASSATKQAPLATDAALSPKEEVVASAKKEETPIRQQQVRRHLPRLQSLHQYLQKQLNQLKTQSLQ
jgi:DedD protein